MDVLTDRLGFATKNRRVHRLGGARWIEILAQVHNLPTGSTEKNHVFLSIDPPRRFDDALRLYFGDRRFRIGQSM